MFRWYRNSNKLPDESVDEFFIRCHGLKAYDKYVRPRKELADAYRETIAIDRKRMDILLGIDDV